MSDAGYGRLGAPYAFPSQWQVFSLRDLCLKIGSGATPSGGQAAYLATRENWALIRSQNVRDRQFDATGLAFISDDQAASLQGVLLKEGKGRDLKRQAQQCFLNGIRSPQFSGAAAQNDVISGPVHAQVQRPEAEHGFLQKLGQH